MATAAISDEGDAPGLNPIRWNGVRFHLIGSNGEFAENCAIYARLTLVAVTWPADGCRARGGARQYLHESGYDQRYSNFQTRQLVGLA